MKRWILVFTIGVVATCNRSSTEEEGRFRTPQGEVIRTMDVPASLQDLGIPLYPGAEAEPMNFNIIKEGASIIGRQLYSKDSIAKVARFYKEQLKSSSPQIIELDDTVAFTIKENEKVSKSVTLFQDEEGAGTEIQLMKMGK